MNPRDAYFLRPRLPSAEGLTSTPHPIPCPSPSGLDDLFLNETRQLLGLGGLRASESLLLQELDANAPNGTSSTERENDFIRVNERSWFRIFRREKWASYNLPLSGFPGKIFDIDDDFIWGRLSPAIELANRILGQALDHGWLSSFLTRDSIEAKTGVSATVDGNRHSNATIYRVIPVPPEKRQTRQETIAALDAVTRNTFWGFHHVDEAGGLLGKTFGHRLEKRGVIAQWCTINTAVLRGLFVKDTPGDPTGRQAIFQTALIMLHELMHAISRRLLLEHSARHGDGLCRAWELFFDEERWAEAGYSFEMNFFGTCLRNTWAPRSPRFAWQGISNPQPGSVGQFQYYGGWSFDDPFIEERRGISADVPSGFSARDFWDVSVKKYGAAALRFGTGVTTATREYAGDEWAAYRAHVTDGDVGEPVRSRRLELRRLRPWYRAEYAQWCETPFALSEMRTGLGVLFKAGRSIKHECDALAAAKRMIYPLGVADDLDRTSTRAGGMARWFFRAVGYLALAALPVRNDAQRWEDEMVGEYPDRLFAGKEFAGPAELLEEAVRFGRRRREGQKSKSRGMSTHVRDSCLYNAQLAFWRWKVGGVVCDELVREFEAALRAVRVGIDASPSDDAWVDFDFRFPEYQGVVHRPSGWADREEEDEEDADLPRWAVAKAGVAGGPVGQNRIRYLTPGEIGDHQVLGGGAKWVLRACDDEREVDVYDVSSSIQGNAWDNGTRDRITIPGPEGHLVGRMIRREHYEQLFNQKSVGRAMLWRRAEDIRINDGREGRPRWVALGSDVFDITDLQLDHDVLDLQQLLRSTQKNPVMEAMDQGYHPNIIIENLRPYQIGWTRNHISGFRRKSRIFTIDEVKWYAFQETGMYVIINTGVYDFTDYHKMHPGGSSIIRRFAGGDASMAWHEAHGNPASRFGVDVHGVLEGLRIGKIVPEQPANQPLSTSQIRIRGLIFSRPDVPAERLEAFNGLEEYWGTDCTHALEEQQPPAALDRLWNSPDLVTSKIVTAPEEKPLMSYETLQKMNGEETGRRSGRKHGFRDSYISDGQFVYNMTTFIRYSPPSAELPILRQLAGRSLGNSADDARVRAWLRENHRHRIIARQSSTLEENPTWTTRNRLLPRASGPEAVTEVNTAPMPKMTWSRVLQGDADNPGPKTAVKPIQTASAQATRGARGKSPSCGRGGVGGNQGRGGRPSNSMNGLWSQPSPSGNGNNTTNNGAGNEDSGWTFVRGKSANRGRGGLWRGNI